MESFKQSVCTQQGLHEDFYIKECVEGSALEKIYVSRLHVVGEEKGK